MSGDLISRQDAIDALDQYRKESGVSELLHWNAVKHVLSHVPSAEPERKKGKWTGDCCPCCGVSKYNYIKMVDDECGPFGTWNFCLNCGADMRGE